MARIIGVTAREVLDSRGRPTVEAIVQTEKGQFSAIAPSGASRGKQEALELRDGEKRFFGRGVRKVIANIQGPIARKLKGMNPAKQREIDLALIELDKTPQKTKLGGNAMVAVSMAVARAGAAQANLPLFEYLGHLSANHKFTLPVPMMNVINGGEHAGNGLQIQEFLILPVGAPSFSEALQCGVTVYESLRELIVKKYGKIATGVGDEGGFAPPFKNTTEALDLLSSAVEKSGYSKWVRLGLDCASSEFFSAGKYRFEGRVMSGHALGEWYEGIVRHYNLLSLEDPFAEEDWNSWEQFSHHYGKIQVVGDDLLVTNPLRVARAIAREACNALLLKVNQVGTLSEALEAARVASEGKWRVIVSHRSGESEDSFISDLVVGLAAGQSKFGAPVRGERTAKYNQLLRIEEQLGKRAKYATPFS